MPHAKFSRKQIFEWLYPPLIGQAEAIAQLSEKKNRECDQDKNISAKAFIFNKFSELLFFRRFKANPQVDFSMFFNRGKRTINNLFRGTRPLLDFCMAGHDSSFGVPWCAMVHSHVTAMGFVAMKAMAAPWHRRGEAMGVSGISCTFMTCHGRSWTFMGCFTGCHGFSCQCQRGDMVIHGSDMLFLWHRLS